MGFKRGQSGNPRGRPKGSKEKYTLKRQQLATMVMEHGDDVVEKVVTLALEGDRLMLKLLMDKILPTLANVSIEGKVELKHKLLALAETTFGGTD